MESLKKDFKMLEDGTVYLDTAATCLKPSSVVDSVSEYYTNYSVNVNRGVYKKAYLVTEKFEDTRNTVAKFINCKKEEVVFTRGASAAINLVALSYGMDNLKVGDEIILSELEHHSNLLPWYNVSKKTGAIIKFVKLVNNRITVDEFRNVLSEKTKFVSLTMMSNVMGYLTPIKKIIELAHEVGAKVLVDAAQAIAHEKVDVKELDCDFLAFSGHKIFGPTGVGVLFGKSSLLKEMSPVEYGGDMVDSISKTGMDPKDHPHKFETGTMPISSVIGLKPAIEYIEKIGYDFIKNYEAYLVEYLEEKLKTVEGVTVFNDLENAILCFNVDGVHPHDAVAIFDNYNICLRAGRHCAQLIIDLLGQQATLRASFYVYNDKEDVDKFIDALKETVEYFQKF